MIENAELVLSFTANLTEAEYASSVVKQYAVKFAFMMLGEDAALISNELKQIYPDIPWLRIKEMRNMVACDNSKTDEKIIWETATTDIAPLLQQLLQIKSDLEQ